MPNFEGKYNIKAICNKLGIQPGTLRAWERRYKIVEPIRNEAGHRLYTDEHVRILKWLLEKTEQGFTISQAVSLLENKESQIEWQSDTTMNRVGTLLQYIENALLSFDETTAHQYLNEALNIFTIDKVLNEILRPLMIKIGYMWEMKQITSAHEHYANAFLRTRIGSILQNIPVNSLLPKAIAVCGPNEAHELGLMFFTLYLRRKGFDVIFLGRSIDLNDMDIVIQETNPKFIFLSATLKENKDPTLQWAQNLVEKHDSIHFGVGGRAFYIQELDDDEELSPLLIGDTDVQWDEWIKKRL